MTVTKPDKQALPGARLSAFQNDPHDLYLETRPGHKYYQPRVNYVPTADEVEWAAEHGIGLPVKVVLEDGKLIVTDGRVRVLILRHANALRESRDLKPLLIACLPLRQNQEALVLKWSAVLNAHRRGDDPITEALACARLLDLGETPEAIRQTMKWECTRTVDNRVKLLQLCDEAQGAVAGGEVGATKALSWVGLTNTEQKAALKAFREGGPKPKQVRRPGRGKLRKVLERLPERNTNLIVLVKWAAGEATDEEVGEAFPALAKALAGDDSTEA
jgi:hypothetical protein